MQNLFDKCAQLRYVLLPPAYYGITAVVTTTLTSKLICSSPFIVLHVEVCTTLQQTATKETVKQITNTV